MQSTAQKNHPLKTTPPLQPTQDAPRKTYSLRDRSKVLRVPTNTNNSDRPSGGFLRRSGSARGHAPSRMRVRGIESRDHSFRGLFGGWSTDAIPDVGGGSAPVALNWKALAVGSVGCVWGLVWGVRGGGLWGSHVCQVSMHVSVDYVSMNYVSVDHLSCVSKSCTPAQPPTALDTQHTGH